ncbi:MAG: DapH/DapD/GlmU-related protein [Candidatus Methanomethylicia archaeon]
MIEGDKYISKKALVSNVTFEGSCVILGQTRIGSNTFIGCRSIIGYPKRTSIKKLISEKNVNWASYDEVSIGATIGENSILRSETIIYEDVDIGREFEGGHRILIREGTRIGINVKVGTNTVIDGNVIIGDHVNIQTAVYIPPKCIIEDHVFIAPRVCFTNDKYPPSKRLEGVIVKRGAILGANCTLISGVTIGEGAVVAAGAVVTRNVPDYSVVAGVPAKVISSREDFENKKSVWEKLFI